MNKSLIYPLVFMTCALPALAQAQRELHGSVRNRQETIRHSGRPPVARPPVAYPPAVRPPVVRPPAIYPPYYRPGDIRREIRHARRDRFLFLAGVAVLGSILREPPPNHVTVVVQSTTYYVADGVYYARAGGQYTVVTAPRGAIITTIPPAALVVRVNSTPYHYFNGDFYLPSGSSYQVVAPPVGAIIPALPEGAVVQGPHVVYGDGYYREVVSNGEVAYQVVARP